MLQKFKIVPYVSVGPIAFGMKRVDLHSVLGAPDRGKKSKFGPRFTDYWLDEDITVVSSSEDGVVEEVSFGAVQREAEIDGYKIFQPLGPDSYRELCQRDKAPRAEVGFTVLFHFGLVLDSFLATDQEQRVVTAFARGVWKEDDPDLTPLRLSK